MRIINKVINTISFVMVLMIFLTTSISATETISPQLRFSYDWRGKTIDTFGYALLQKTFDFRKVDVRVIAKFKEEMPLFEATWQKDGPMFFGEVFDTFHHGFLEEQKTAIVFLGATIGYGNKHALMLGLAFLFNNDRWDNAISREDYFSWLLFHELLHVWTEEHVGYQSPLLENYCNEDQETLEHIHLMAIQKMVYLKLNRLDLLEFSDQWYRKYPNGYRRSWEIVNDIEGYELVIDDIKQRLVELEKNPLFVQQGLWANVYGSVTVVKDMFKKVFFGW